MGLWKRPLLQSVHAGLMTPQYDGPEIPSYVHHASQLALANCGAAATRTIRAGNVAILFGLSGRQFPFGVRGLQQSLIMLSEVEFLLPHIPRDPFCRRTSAQCPEMVDCRRRRPIQE